MSLLVSGVATALAVGIDPAYPGRRFASWLPSWAIAFPAVLFVAPLVRRILARIVLAPEPHANSTGSANDS